MEFNVYLSNLNCIEKYIENTPSKFTNDIIPPIQLNPPTNWEVALKSCILPFQSFMLLWYTVFRALDCTLIYDSIM